MTYARWITTLQRSADSILKTEREMIIVTIERGKIETKSIAKKTGNAQGDTTTGPKQSIRIVPQVAVTAGTLTTPPDPLVHRELTEENHVVDVQSTRDVSVPIALKTILVTTVTTIYAWHFANNDATPSKGSK